MNRKQPKLVIVFANGFGITVTCDPKNIPANWDECMSAALNGYRAVKDAPRAEAAK